MYKVNLSKLPVRLHHKCKQNPVVLTSEKPVTCKVQVIKRAAHYCTFTHSCLLNYRNNKTTTLNFEMFLSRMFSKHYMYCKVEHEAKFEAKFFSHLTILQPVKLAFDCHWYFDTGSETSECFFFSDWGISFAFIQVQRVHFLTTSVWKY